MDEINLRQGDFDAADEVLRRFPEDEPIASVKRKLLAELHARFGKSRFNLYYKLREPRSRYEEWRFQYYHGQITLEQMRDLMRTRAERAVDQEMLDELYSQVEKQLGQYSRGLQAAAKTLVSNCSRQQQRILEDQATESFRRTKRKFTLDKQEISTAQSFLDDVRLENSLGLARVGEVRATNAVYLVLLVFDRAVQTWDSCSSIAKRSQTQPNYLYAITAAKLLFRENGPCLPPPQELLALLEQESNAARLSLKKRDSESTSPAAPPEIANAVLHIQNAQIEVGVLQAALARKTPAPSKAEPLLRVEHWSELAIGIDEDRSLWALSPAPAVGRPFPKSKAHRLDVSAKQLKKLLVAFADSISGDEVLATELLKTLDMLPPGANIQSDGRAMPGELETAIKAELTSGTAAALSALRKTVGDLGRKFRTSVAGPRGEPDSCFRFDSPYVRSGFRVRYLFRTENGTFSFGAKPICGG